MSRVIVVSNRLPVTLHPQREAPDDVEQSSGGLVSALRSIVDDFEELVWIGWPGSFVANEAEEQRMTTRLRQASGTIQMVPVWLSQRDAEEFYNGFSNSSLWPLLHWMTPYARFKRSWADAYRRVNERFADVILEVATADDLIWVQDYQLFLVPQMLRRKASALEEDLPVVRPKETAPLPLRTGVRFSDEAQRPSGPAAEAPRRKQRLRLAELGPDVASPRLADRDSSAGAAGHTAWHSDFERTKSGVPRNMVQGRLGSKLKIAFFLHTPFPAYEVLCVLPQSNEVIQGMLGADLVGFHTYSYLRHFRSCVIRLCGLSTEIDHVDHRGQRTQLGVFPIGANWQGISAAMKSERFEHHLQEYTDRFQGRSLVLSVERLDYSKGMPQKLAAIERYLEQAQEDMDSSGSSAGGARHSRLQDLQKRFEERRVKRGISTSNFGRLGGYVKALFSKAFARDDESQELDHTKTVFLFIAVPSRQEVQEYKTIEEEVHRTVSTINGRFSTPTHQPIVYIHRGVSIEELAALYARADCCLVTPLIDGMNLVAKEFIAAKDRQVENVVPGAIVLSELAGAAQELFDAIVVNPYDVDAVADAISIGLELARGGYLDEDLRWEMTARMREAVLQNDAVAWARTLLKELQAPYTSSVASPVEESSMQLLRDSVACTFFESNPGIKALFLDYDGTLREFERRPEDALPTAELLEIFKQLDARSDLKVFLVSGRSKEFMEDHFGGFRSFHLIAEHGYVKRGPNTGHEWRPFNPYTSHEWMDKVLPVMELFRRCTPGARVEVKAAGIVWHYCECDDEYGRFKAKELMHQLALSLGNLPCQISLGRKIVDVVSLQVTKGVVVRSACLEREAASDPFSEVLCVGDDSTDESMFLESPPGTWTVKVGQGDTHARYRLPEPADVRRFLRLIVDQHLPCTPRAPVSMDSDLRARFRSLDNSTTEGDDSRQGNEDDPLALLPEFETEEAASGGQ